MDSVLFWVWPLYGNRVTELPRRDRFPAYAHIVLIPAVNSVSLLGCHIQFPVGTTDAGRTNHSANVWLYPFQPSVSITLLNQMFAVRYQHFVIYPLLTRALFKIIKEKRLTYISWVWVLNTLPCFYSIKSGRGDLFTDFIYFCMHLILLWIHRTNLGQILIWDADASDKSHSVVLSQ